MLNDNHNKTDTSVIGMSSNDTRDLSAGAKGPFKEGTLQQKGESGPDSKVSLNGMNKL